MANRPVVHAGEGGGMMDIGIQIAIFWAITWVIATLFTWLTRDEYCEQNFFCYVVLGGLGMIAIIMWILMDWPLNFKRFSIRKTKEPTPKLIIEYKPPIRNIHYPDKKHKVPSTYHSSSRRRTNAFPTPTDSWDGDTDGSEGFL